MVFREAFDVAAPPETVWAVMFDVERWHEWTPSVQEITLLDDASFAVGSRALIRQPKLPRAVWTVTALEPDAGFTWMSRSPGVRVHADHAIEPTPGGSRVTLTLRYEGLLGGLMARLTRALTTRYLGWEAAGLKQRCETQAATPRGDERNP